MDTKLRKHSTQGFTMAELLIVVAIIAVLVAIAIPVFTSQLEKSREATDLANVRSAYAALQIAKIEGTNPDGSAPDNGIGSTTIYVFTGSGFRAPDKTNKDEAVKLTSNSDLSFLSDLITMPHDIHGFPNPESANGCFIATWRYESGGSWVTALTVLPAVFLGWSE